MSNDIIQVQYDTLKEVARRFGQQAEATAQMQGRVQQSLRTLQSGGWEGRGSAAFFAEMQDTVLPATQRLSQALQQADAVTRAIAQLMRQAEEEASAPFKGGAAAVPAGVPADTTGSGAADNPAAARNDGWTWQDTVKTLAKTLLWAYKDRGALASILAAGGQWSKMVRFVQGSDGLWRAFGSHAAKEALGLPAHFTRFGEKAIEQSIKSHSLFEMIKTAVKGEGPFAARAAQLLDDIKGIGGLKTPPLWATNGFLKNVKGPAIISTLVTLGSNIYEFGFGANQDKGLLSREFLTSTGADVTAGLGIVGVSTAIGTMIPVPGVGTAVGFVVGLGLQYAYDRWGKDAWRSVVDGAAQRVGPALSSAWNGAQEMAGQVSRAANDAWNQVTQTGADMGRGVVNTFNGLAEAGSRLLSPLSWAFGG